MSAALSGDAQPPSSAAGNDEQRGREKDQRAAPRGGAAFGAAAAGEDAPHEAAVLHPAHSPLSCRKWSVMR